MNLQQERIDSLCEELGLKGLTNNYSHLCATAAKEEWSFIDFLEKTLKSEAEAKDLRRTQMLRKTAGFPMLKTLERYDFEFAQGVPKKQLEELSKLTFIQKKENIIFLGASGVGKTHLAIALGDLATQAVG